MTNKPYYKAGDIAKRLNIHANTVRSWSDTYKELMSVGATANKRKFTEDDILILATIADFRNAGMDFDAIGQALKNGQRIEDVPEQPTKAEIETRQNADVMLKSEHDAILASYQADADKALQRVNALESELKELRLERDRVIDRWQTDTSDLNAKIQGLERELGIAQGKLQTMETAQNTALDTIKQERKTADYWLRVIVAVIFITVLFAVALGVLLSSSAG